MGFVASAGRMRTDTIGSLETSALARVQAACNFVNAEAARLRNQTIAIGVVCVAAAFLLWIVTGFGDPRVVLVAAAGISVLAFVRARAELTSTYTNIAAKRIIAGLGKQLTYNPRSSLTRQQFLAMDLFTEQCERWNSRDEIVGRTRAAKYSLHQVRAAGRDRKAAFFDGVIIKIDFTEGFPGHTVILPDRDGLLLGAPNSAAATRRRKDLVMLKNPAFEQLFDVYSTDYYEARQLVTPRFMEIVMEAQARLDTELRLCFVQKSLFVAVARCAIRFEATLRAAPLTPQAAVGKLVHLVSLADRLAETRS